MPSCLLIPNSPVFCVFHQKIKKNNNQTLTASLLCPKFLFLTYHCCQISLLGSKMIKSQKEVKMYGLSVLSILQYHLETTLTPKRIICYCAFWLNAADLISCLIFVRWFVVLLLHELILCGLIISIASPSGCMGSW